MKDVKTRSNVHNHDNNNNNNEDDNDDDGPKLIMEDGPTHDTNRRTTADDKNHHRHPRDGGGDGGGGNRTASVATTVSSTSSRTNRPSHRTRAEREEKKAAAAVSGRGRGGVSKTISGSVGVGGDGPAIRPGAVSVIPGVATAVVAIRRMKRNNQKGKKTEIKDGKADFTLEETDGPSLIMSERLVGQESNDNDNGEILQKVPYFSTAHPTSRSRAMKEKEKLAKKADLDETDGPSLIMSEHLTEQESSNNDNGEILQKVPYFSAAHPTARSRAMKEKEKLAKKADLDETDGPSLVFDDSNAFTKVSPGAVVGKNMSTTVPTVGAIPAKKEGYTPGNKEISAKKNQQTSDEKTGRNRHQGRRRRRLLQQEQNGKETVPSKKVDLVEKGSSKKNPWRPWKSSAAANKSKEGVHLNEDKTNVDNNNINNNNGTDGPSLVLDDGPESVLDKGSAIPTGSMHRDERARNDRHRARKWKRWTRAVAPGAVSANETPASTDRDNSMGNENLQNPAGSINHTNIVADQDMPGTTNMTTDTLKSFPSNIYDADTTSNHYDIESTGPALMTTQEPLNVTARDEYSSKLMEASMTSMMPSNHQQQQRQPPPDGRGLLSRPLSATVVMHISDEERRRQQKEAAAKEEELFRQQAQEDAEANMQLQIVDAMDVAVVEKDESKLKNRKVYTGIAVFLIAAILAIVLSVTLTSRPETTEPTIVTVGPNFLCIEAIGITNNTFMQFDSSENVSFYFDNGDDDEGDSDSDIFFASAKGNLVPSERELTKCQTPTYTDDIPRSGFWYYVDGNGGRMRASTCGGDTEADTIVLVFKGGPIDSIDDVVGQEITTESSSSSSSSCDALECVGSSDGLCGAQGSIGWFAEEGIRYYILVRGVDDKEESAGPFKLTIENLVDNGSCSAATDIDESLSSGTDVEIFGSTRHFFIEDDNDNSISAETCGDTTSTASGSWYQIEGNGEAICTFATGERLNEGTFPLELSIFEQNGSNACDDLTCVDGAIEDRSSTSADRGSGTEAVAWFAEKGTTYNIFVRGEKADEETSTGNNAGGDFFLHLHSASNALCETAIDVEPFVTNGDGSQTTSSSSPEVITGTLANPCSNDNNNFYYANDNVPEGCYDDEYVNFQRSTTNLRGVWYKVTPSSTTTSNDRGTLTATVSGLDCTESRISVYKSDANNNHDCSALQCVEDEVQNHLDSCSDNNDNDGNDESNNNKIMTSQWTFDNNNNPNDEDTYYYYLFIQSSGRVNGFELSIVIDEE